MKLNIMQITGTHKCLVEVLLPVKNTGFAYAINRNINSFEIVIKEQKRFLDKTQAQFLKKNEDGNFITDPNGDPMIDVDSKEYKDFYDSFLKEEIDVEIYDFPQDKVKDCFDSGKFDGLNLSPLFGILIT